MQADDSLTIAVSVILSMTACATSSCHNWLLRHMRSHWHWLRH